MATKEKTAPTTKAKRICRFGGENLKSPAHTWYVNKETRGQFNVGPGDEVDADLVDNLDHYLKTGRAELVES